MPMTLRTLLPKLRCPRTHSELELEGSEIVSKSGERYPLVDGKPVLVRTIQEFHLTPPADAVISQTMKHFTPPSDLGENGFCVNLGSGNVPCGDPRVVSIDVLPNKNVDLIAEAEALPLQTGSVDHIASHSVFEHLYNPIGAAAEARRVLKDGGTLLIDTAFMQGYHGFPSHYFNMTPQAVESILCDDFILETSFVPGHLSVTHALATQIERFLELLPIERAQMLRGLPLWATVDLLRQATTMSAPLLSGLTEYGHRSLAASFTVLARKPENYEALRDTANGMQAQRVLYYAARTGLIQRHHEIDLYSMMIRDQGRSVPHVVVRSLPDILSDVKVGDPMVPGAFRAGYDRAMQLDMELTRIRDEVIRTYLGVAR